MNEAPDTTFATYFRILTRRWWLFILLPVITVAGVWLMNQSAEPEYTAYERLQIIPAETQRVELFARTPTLNTAQQLQSVHDDFYDVIRLPSVAWKTIDQLGLDMTAEEFIKRIDTQHFSEFITVSIRMPKPELAKDAVTVHTQNAIETFRQIRTTPAQVNLTFLEDQVAEHARQLEAVRARLQAFQLEHDVSQLPTDIAAAQDARRTLAMERDRLLAQAAQAEALAENYDHMAQRSLQQAQVLQEELLAAAPITTTEGVSETQVITPTAVITVTTATATQKELTTASLKALLARAAQQQSRAQEQQALAAGYRAAAADYDRILQERQQAIDQLVALQTEYQGLNDQLKQAQGMYDFLVDKTNEARLKVTQGDSVGYLTVITPARTPTEPTPRHVMQSLLVGVLASLLLALLLAFVLEIIERYTASRD